MELYLGTGGFSYPYWKGIFYPPGLKPRDYLWHYARHFNAVEVNASFYHVPAAKTFAGMLERSGGRVRFAVKVHRSVTHARDATDELYARLFEATRPLAEAGVLGPFVAQFPYAFHRTPANRRYLLEVARRFEGRRLAIELRHASWAREPVWDAFRELGLVWVSADYPPLAGLPQSGLVVTAPVAYLRLMGRNAAKWWDHQEREERYDYLYAPEELRPYARGLAAHAGELQEAWVIFHNTPRGQALANLGTMKDLLAEQGLVAPIEPPRPG
ncbi:DUF72 domain-containing protein [Oceanithermus desulfurans]|uniref:DUF72 domain-containing protein n=1 Tax=Oceanithermus profundus TaxID=187137 RepID=A0A7C5SQQ4_9DEIN|nr:DUF72 domain-containing protein [Oceanithermus profundus]